MKGKFIGVKEKTNVFVLSKTFFVKGIENAVLTATALGLYYVKINGERVGDAYMTPGWTAYDKTLQKQTYDVSGLLKKGENIIELTVAGGWYCSGMAWDRSMIWGERPAVCADLTNGRQVIFTDESWIARESEIRFSGIYAGETWDFTAPLNELSPIEIEYNKKNIVEQISEPVKNVQRIPAISVFRTPKGELVYDFGQNLVGVVEIETPEDFDGSILLQFAEILDKDNFYTKNLRTATSTDRFTVKGKRILCAEFTFHGFRYMKMEGAELPKEKVVAIVRHTDMKRTGYIKTEDKRFQRLMDNVVWSQRGNFLDIPTDCPQRDERLGWLGDAAVFCQTAAFNYDVRNFFKKWLLDIRNSQTEEGKIPNFVPFIHMSNDWIGMDALWGDAIVFIPWTLYKTYGDISFLSDNFDAMKKLLTATERTIVNGLTTNSHRYGDWLALDREPFSPGDNHGRTDPDFIANVFYIGCLQTVSEIAEVLGEEEYARSCREKHAQQIKNVRNEYVTPSGRIATDTVTAMVLALHFHIIPEEKRKYLAEVLNRNIIKRRYRISTGFIGTPYLLFVLADNGYMETAEKILLYEGYPSWLYAVDMGATTIWERWNSLLPDGSPSPNDSMNSYNHYAYGAVMEFVYRRIAGIEPIGVGFEKIRISPTPLKQISSLCAEYESVRGKIVAGYRQKEGGVEFFADVPHGIYAEFILPGEGVVAKGSGNFSFFRNR